MGAGEGIKDYVHVEDLAEFYAILLVKVLSDANSVPFGEKGVVFAANGQFTWRSLSDRLAKVGHDLGKLESPEAKSVSIEEAIAIGMGATEQAVELRFASRFVQFS